MSSGQVSIAVPDVTRMSEANAIAALEAAKLKYGVSTTSYSPDLPQGTVISSDPAAGPGVGAKKIHEGDTVNLVVSNGLVSVPDVTGQAIAAANSALSPLQLNVKVTVDMSCSGGTVASQSIVGEQPQKSTITLSYCGG